MKKFRITLPLTLLGLVAVFTIALMVGRYNIGFSSFFKAVFTKYAVYSVQRTIIFNLRLPRTAMALLAGIGLSVSGLLYQEIFQNKLVSPDLLGVSAGSSVGAASAILLGLGPIFISMFSFSLGLLTVFLTLLIARLFKNGSPTILLISGILIGGMMSAVLAFLKYFADPQTTLASIVYWEMGSFGNALYSQVLIMAVVVLICVSILLLISWRINIVALGETEAKTKGINYQVYKHCIIIIATLLTAISVCFSGKIAWVGLVVPHITRLFIGRNTKYSIPLSITIGATFMVVCDIISRSFTDSEVPLSATTSLLSTIIVVFILVFKRFRRSNEY